MAALPFLLPPPQTAMATACLAAHLAAAAAVELPQLAEVLQDISIRSRADVAASVQLLAKPLTSALFPRSCRPHVFPF